MGAKVTFDSVTRLIQVTQAPALQDGEYVIELDVKIDLYSDGKEDWLANEALRRVKFPISVIGGDPVPGGFAGDTYFIDAGWKIVPYEADHRFLVKGNLYSRDGKSPFRKTNGSFNVFLEQQVSTLVQTVQSGSGVLPSDITDIADAVWNKTVP